MTLPSPALADGDAPTADDLLAAVDADGDREVRLGSVRNALGPPSGSGS